jgi:hypothetical protein
MGTVTSNATALDKMLGPLGECLNAEAAKRVVELRIDPEVVARVEVLADKANEGLLTEEERAEYQSYVDAADFIAIFKTKARGILEANGNP